MRKKTLTRIQLLLLLLVTGLVLLRVFSGPGGAKGTMVIDDVDQSELKKVDFKVTAPVRIAIDAAGSYTSAEETEPSDMTVYGWILDSNSREVVWKMQDAPVRVNNTLVSVVDTVMIQPGNYSAYFTSYGNYVNESRGRILGIRYGRDWISDAGNWHFVLQVVSPDEEDLVVVGEPEPVNNPLQIWTTGPVKAAGTLQYVFDVTDDVELEVYSIGEHCKTPCDFGGIMDYISGDTLWTLSLENGTYAGGRQENIGFRGTVSLGPGTYRAFYQTDHGHSYRNWAANPPFDPEGWGMTISVRDAASLAAVSAFDPFLQREPIIGITRVGPGVDERVPFSCADSVSVLVYAMGELTSSGSLYDYATIKEVSTGDKIWEMSYRKSEPAGGYETNRKEIAIIHLTPGRYELAYQSDMSHDYSEFSNGAPDMPERWGVTMFPFERTLPPGAITVQQAVAVQESNLNPAEIDVGQVIVNATQLGNGQKVSNSFSLNTLTIVRIIAVGEISTSGQYDYGWIEDNDTGQIVWEMTRRNTEHAGGDDHNRKFDGLLELEPGNYTAHFKTDFTHAFGDFGDGGPDRPSDWGIRIETILSND